MTAIVTSPAGAVAKFYDEYICFVSVCLSARISPETHTARAIFTKFFVHVARSSALLRHANDGPHHLLAGRGDGSAQHGRSVIYDCLVLVVMLFCVQMSTGSSHQVEVIDGVNVSHCEMSLKDWMTYYSGSDRGGSLLTMNVEFSRSKLEKCLELPEIVCFVFTTSSSIVCMHSSVALFSVF